MTRSATDRSEATKFITTLFGEGTVMPVYVCSLPNERDDPSEPPMRRVSTRDGEDITKFIAKWDRPKRGLFFCVGTLQPGTDRKKENVRELAFLHADIDFKDITIRPDEVRQVLAALECPPSLMVASGNGLHAYWLLTEAIDAQAEMERIEQALRLLSDVVGGDPAVCEIARLMRLPGTHNSKGGQWLPVVVEQASERRYELDDLEEWLARTSPKIVRRDKPARSADNPFLMAAARLGFKPPIDVEQRLSAMSYGGVGDTSIHSTQLAVTASLLSSGRDLEEAVEAVLNATRAAAGGYGERWNWRREERAVRQMCETWLRKHPPQQQRETTRAVAGGGNVVQFERPAKEKPGKKRSGDVPLHIVLGEAVIEAVRHRGDDLIFTPRAAYRFVDGLWRMEIDGLKTWLDVEIETAARALNIESNNRTVSEARQWITRNPDLWRETVEWDSHGKIPTRSGLINPRTLEIIPSSPEHYCTWRIDCAYDPLAKCPWWEIMIGDFFGDRSSEQRANLIRVVQEVFGAALIDVKPRALSKALIFQGGSNFGKSGILEVLGGLFSSDQISTGLEALETPHGLMAFTRRLPWVLHEAFDQRKWHFSSMVKAIITGEPVNINVKNGPMLSARVKAPIFWGTNHPPQFKEATKAIINRMIVIECRREFFEGNLVGAAEEAARRGMDKPSTLILETELPGLLNWAIAGLGRALQRNFIELTDEIADTANEIRRDSNLVAGFMEECIDYNPNFRLSIPDYCAAFAVWWLENKGEDRRLPSNESVSKALVAMSDPMIAISSKELRDRTRRYYAGIKLNEQGEAFWRRAVEAKAFEGKTASTTLADREVNSPIPEEWASKSTVIAMRARHKMTAEDAVTVRKNGQNTTVTDTHNCHPKCQSELSRDSFESEQLSPEKAQQNKGQPLF